MKKVEEVSADQLVTTIGSLMQSWSGPVEIMAGHTRLAWDATEQRLLPALRGYRGTSSLWRAFLEEFDEFARITFRWGLDLLEIRPAAACALLSAGSARVVS